MNYNSRLEEPNSTDVFIGGVSRFNLIYAELKN